jgi:hypothetical protein
MLFLHAGLFAPVDAATYARPSNSLIRIWVVGSPHTNELPSAVVPPDLRQRAESLGYSIEIQGFRASGFTAYFHQALQNHYEPEILAFDNYGVISNVKTPVGRFEGIDSNGRTASTLALVHETMSSLQRVGWVMLVSSAANYEAARTLAMRPVECDPQSARGNHAAITTPALREAQEKAVLATRAYIDCDHSTLAAISDPSRMVQQCFQPQSDTKVESVKACRVSGNNKLAFVSLVGGFSAVVRDPRALVPSKPGMDLGQRSILAVLRNESGTWQLLAITHDLWNTGARTTVAMNTLVNSLDKESFTSITPEPARLLTPNGVYPAPQNGQRFGDFIWEPSQSTDVIGQVAEFMWGKDANWNLTRLFFLPANVNKLSSGGLMVGGTTMWRVWSISKSGDVVFSEQHSFKHCPCPAICGDWP